MAFDNRMFEPPAPDLARINARLQGLRPPLPALIRRAGDALAIGDLGSAQSMLARALALASGQADVLRLYGLLLAKIGNLPAAFANFEAALAAAPDDAMGYWQYAHTCEVSGDLAAAWRLREQATQRLPESPMAWADLGEHLARHQQPGLALAPLERAVQLAPGYAPAQLKLGSALVSCGRAADGAVAIRKAIAIEPTFGAAWLELVDIRTVPVTDAEVEQMRALLRGRAIDEGERTAISFALGKACEDRALYAEAFELLVDANARRKREVGPWDANRFLHRVRRGEEVFAARHAAAEDPRLGSQAIFIVGLPRAGTTLVEQILASHPDVQALGELGDLAQVLTEESARRQCQYPDWVPEAGARDWQRLGGRYLELVGRRRDAHARFTDKMPNNWQALGAIRAMLPGARIAVCRRDPVENCWSCFKQFFANGWEFTCDMEQLATFWAAFDRAASWWGARDRGHVREQAYESLTEDPEPQIRALLEFCGLPFRPSCLRPHEARRPVHTLSAAQVRQPMRRTADLAAGYGTLLDPLRTALRIAAASVAAGRVDAIGRQ